jgi:hypothetical protein
MLVALSTHPPLSSHRFLTDDKKLQTNILDIIDIIDIIREIILKFFVAHNLLTLVQTSHLNSIRT